MLALSTLHDAYAPVDVGREAVAQVVRLGTGYVCAGVERLVAHQHAVTKRTPVEFVGRSKSAWMQHNPLFVDDVRVAVEHGRQFSVRSFVDIIRYLLKRIVIGQRVAGVEEHHVVARSQTQSLVHGVVQSAVGLRDDAHVVFGLLLQATLSVSLRHLHGVVLRRTVYYQVFYLPPRLVEYAVERRLYHFVVNLNIFHRNRLLRIAHCHLMQAVSGELFRVGFIERPAYAFGEVGCVLEVCDVSVAFVVYHLRYAAHAEAHARHAASHRLHDCVRQIVFKRRQNIHIGCVVDARYLLCVADISQRERRNVQLLGYLVCACAEYGHGSLCLELRIGVGKAVDSLDEVGCALALVGHLLRNEQHYAALFGQSHLQACCGTVFRAEDVRVDGVRNRHNLLARE